MPHVTLHVARAVVIECTVFLPCLALPQLNAGNYKGLKALLCNFVSAAIALAMLLY